MSRAVSFTARRPHPSGDEGQYPARRRWEGEGGTRRLLSVFLLALALLLYGMSTAEAAVQRVVSPQGIEAWLIEDRGNPLISIAIGFRGGAAADPAGKEGLARLVAGLLDEGAGDLDSTAFQAEIADRGIDFGFTADKDNITGRVRTLTRDRDEAFRLLRLALTAPRFDDAAIKRVRAQLLSALSRDAGNPQMIASHAWMRLELGDHPYGRSAKGTPAGLAAIAAADLHGFVARRFGRDQMRIAVVGDIDAAALAPLLDRTFAALPAKAGPIMVPPGRVAAEGGTAVVDQDLAQSIINFGHGGIARDDPDFYAAVLLDDIMGGGNFDSRLVKSLREQRGLVYSVETNLETFDQAALLAGSLGTKNASAGEAVALVRAEWQRMHDDGPSEAELAGAKIHVIGGFPLRFTSTASAASTLLGIQLDGLPIDYPEKRAALYRAVSLADAKRVARRLYDPAALRFLALGRPEGVTATLPAPAPAN